MARKIIRDFVIAGPTPAGQAKRPVEVVEMPSFENRFRIRDPVNILKAEEKKQIHETALGIMERTGIQVQSATARMSLARAGALVDDKSMTVKFPPGLVDSLMSEVPRTVVLAGRAPEFDLPVDHTHFYSTTDGCGVSVYDCKAGTRRESRLEDIRRTAIISDWLPYVSIYEPMVVAHDVPSKMHVVSGLSEAIKNTTKHIETESTTTPGEAQAQVRMASEVVGSLEELRKRHYISAMVCTVSPLILEGPATEAAMVWAENHVPVHITGMGMMGMTGPATIAGDLAMNHAETLALACAMQAHSPGCPALYGSVLSSMNPMTGAIDFGSPETIALACTSAEMGRYVNMPVSAGGLGPGAKVPGIQASIENTMISAMAAMVGSEIMNGVGLLDCSTVLAYEELVIDNDLFGLTVSSARKIEVNAETLAKEVIEKVGIGGTFLKELHTARHIREFYQPLIWSSEPFEDWVRAGRKDLLTVAKEKADQILASHKPEPLDRSISEKLDAIVKEHGK
ncbi:MAG: trimethylamine methyltransferase family protein [Candidatus Thermoplasmatota archaeon]|nr:trimethylamine methyltransferase family protein [Candidatus Thermoplasmatota archaeon]